jgi:triacylglycerol lipase
VGDRLGRVLMLGPPNKGSEVVDALKGLPGYSWLNGPAGYQLGTDDNSVPLRLPAVDFSLGIIAGNRSIDPISSFFLPNPDDGKVSVASTRV